MLTIVKLEISGRLLKLSWGNIGVFLGPSWGALGTLSGRGRRRYLWKEEDQKGVGNRGGGGSNEEEEEEEDEEV